MLIQLLLSTLFIHFVLSTTNVNNNDNSKETDFMPLLVNPIKDGFDWTLLQKVAAAKGHKNVIISPISLKLVLAILYEGSAGRTQKEFQNILKFPVDAKELRERYRNFITRVSETQNKYVINIGSRLFLDSHLTVEQQFGAKVKHFYQTDVASTNFSNTREASTDINSWVNSLTNGTIKTLVSPDDLENAVLIAANAIYFKGLWRTPFSKSQTFEGDFHTSSNEIVKVDYMTTTDIFYYSTSKILGAKILRMPYLGRKFSIYVILPDDKDRLAHLINNIDLRELALTVSFMVEKNVSVVMPKFRFDFESKYSEILRDIGFSHLFSGPSSFPGIVRDEHVRLVVNDILQKSGIDVNEDGSIIYSSTQVTLGNKFGVAPTVSFNMTHPFLFFIMDEAVSKEILFIGKVENPLENNLPSRFGNTQTPQYPPVNQGDPSQIYPEAGQYNPTVRPNFDLELLKKSIGSSRNVLISPASVKVSLAMLAEAAVGSTANQIYDVLGIPSPRRTIQGLVNELTEKIPDSYLRFENVLFVSNKQTVKNKYIDDVGKNYKALLKLLDFHDRNRAASEINTFINNATNGYVPAAISPDEIAYHTEILLTNILHFKGSWLKTFESTLTRTACFHAPTGCVDTPLMHMIEIFPYAETQNAQIVKLDYTGHQRAMLLVVPKDQDGLSHALKDIASQSFKELLGKLNNTEVELYLPKFEINYGEDIVDTLKQMGISQVFEKNANLANLLEGDRQNFVDSFVHKTKIEVSEEGTEASALSLVSVIPLMGTSTPNVRADRPFAFFIYNTASANILFEGILNEPESNIVAKPEKTAKPTIQERPYQQPVNGRNSLSIQQEEQRKEPIFRH